MGPFDLIHLSKRLKKSKQLNDLMEEGFLVEIISRRFSWDERFGALGSLRGIKKDPFSRWREKLFKTLAWEAHNDSQVIWLAVAWEKGCKWPKGRGKFFKERVCFLRDSPLLSKKIARILSSEEDRKRARDFFQSHGVQT